MTDILYRLRPPCRITNHIYSSILYQRFRCRLLLIRENICQGCVVHNPAIPNLSFNVGCLHRLSLFRLWLHFFIKMIFLVVCKYVLDYHVMSNIIATKCVDVTVVQVLAEEFLLSAAVVTIYSSKGVSASPHGPIHGCPSYRFNRRFFLRKPA